VKLTSCATTYVVKNNTKKYEGEMTYLVSCIEEWLCVLQFWPYIAARERQNCVQETSCATTYIIKNNAKKYEGEMT